MGREVRKVPPDWEHPKNERGAYQPMYDRTLKDEIEELIKHGEYNEKNPPSPDYYLPEWPEGSATHYQMYETTSEGTPISPVFATPEELARWLADTGASSFADMTATYEEWLRVCKGNSAPSAAIGSDGKMISGVAAKL